MQRFLDIHPEKKGSLEYVKNRIKYDSYMWNYERLADKYKYIFIERVSAEFKEDMENGKIDKRYFEEYKWNNLLFIIEDPITWHTKRMLNQETRYVGKSENEKILNSTSYRVGRAVTLIPRKIKGLILCIKDHGIFYTLKHAIKKL